MSIEIRIRAIGMLEDGLIQRGVTSRLVKGIRTIKMWWKRHINNESLLHRPSAGRPTKLNPVAKMIIGKYLGKRHQYTRRLPENLKSKGYSSSKSSVEVVSILGCVMQYVHPLPLCRL